MTNDIFQKLQIKGGQQLLLINTPPPLVPHLIGPFTTLFTGGETGRWDAVLVFCHTAKEVEDLMPQAIDYLENDGLLWVAYPKKSSKIPTDINRDHGWQPLELRGWLPVRQVAVDEDWSALRFRKREAIGELRRGTDYPGIDSASKQVLLPGDLEEALQRAGLVEVFQGQAFTIRKEAVVSLITAKRPETRTARLQKILDALQK